MQPHQRLHEVATHQRRATGRWCVLTACSPWWGCTRELRGPAGTLTLHGSGQGALEAWVAGLQQQFGIALEVTGYSEHAMTTGTQAKAAAYVQIRCVGASYSGVDLHQDNRTLVRPDCVQSLVGLHEGNGATFGGLNPVSVKSRNHTTVRKLNAS